MAQFFSPDPHIQAPSNWFNYNRYGYCYNNPLIHNDPSGEFIGYLLAIWGGNYLINSTAYAINNKVSLGTAFKATPFIGGVGFSPSGFMGGQSNMGFSHPQLDAHLAMKNEMRVSSDLDAFMASQSGIGMPQSESFSFNYKMGHSTISQLGFGISTGLGRGAMTAIEKEVIRQEVFNASIAHPKFRPKEIPHASFRAPKWLRYAGKYGGFGFSAWGAADISKQYQTGQISESEMWREQGSNAVGALPLVGTGWTIGWEAGRAISNTSAYQNFKYNFWRSYYEGKAGVSIISDPVLWNHFHRQYKP
jgi:hypothetical protein